MPLENSDRVEQWDIGSRQAVTARRLMGEIISFMYNVDEGGICDVSDYLLAMFLRMKTGV